MCSELPLVSVIMPVLDNDIYLSDSIQSILSQSYNNIELVIIDDSKHELCYNIINSIEDNRIKYFKGPRKNLSSALNMGIDNSLGVYIARMDSDDLANPERISLQVKALEENQWQICGTWIKQFGADSRIYTYPVDSNEIKYWMMFTCSIAHPTVLAKAEIFHRFKYNVKSRVEDHELWTRMLRGNVVFGNIPLPLLRYRRHRDAATSSISDELLIERENILKNYANYLFDSNLIVPFLKNSCGTSKEYKENEIIELCDFLYGFVQNKIVKRDLLLKMLPVYFRKFPDMNIKLFILYLKLLKKYELPLIRPETIYIGILSIFKIKRDSRLYSLKVLISSAS
uniref:glycosyltransferase family 2 protein n=1 Tax=Algoriphagus sp. TaxID=1872435 RepID=UPI00404777E9